MLVWLPWCKSATATHRLLPLLSLWLHCQVQEIFGEAARTQPGRRSFIRLSRTVGVRGWYCYTLLKLLLVLWMHCFSWSYFSLTNQKSWAHLQRRNLSTTWAPSLLGITENTYFFYSSKLAHDRFSAAKWHSLSVPTSMTQVIRDNMGD